MSDPIKDVPSGVETTTSSQNASKPAPAIEFDYVPTIKGWQRPLPGGPLLRDFIREQNSQANAHVDRILPKLIEQEATLNPIVIDYFRDEKLYNALPATIRKSDAELGSYMLNSSRFMDSINSQQMRKLAQTESFFGDRVELPKTAHADGRLRREEEGHRLNVDVLNKIGVDPSKVLFFRLTQPGDLPKPEYYWTSDYFETQRGLTNEINREQRKTAVVLVADLATINQNGGLIDDINDDQGLAVRQISLDAFDQNNALGGFNYMTGEPYKPSYAAGTKSNISGRIVHTPIPVPRPSDSTIDDNVW